MVKPVSQMTLAELTEESKALNKRIMLDRRQPHAEKRQAWRKLKAPKMMAKGYIDALKKLYE